MNIRPDYATLTPEEFFAWVPGQEGRYELVEGEVVMMAGAGRRHDAIVVNLIASIRPQTRGGPCQTFTGDTYIATTASTRRMPDMGIDCGKPDENSLTADKPSLVVEVLSPTTGGFDLTVKLAEYQGLSSLDFILFVDTESPTVHLYRRGTDQLWNDAVLKGLDAVVELEKLKISMPLRDIYEGLQFRPKPKLVQNSQEDTEPDSGFRPT
ncbi:Uma2 family endonuclease [Bradyrhizobium sp. USDA 4471]